MLRFCPLSLRIMEKVVEIREATREDCREIRTLIQELADFEEMPDGPKIDHEILEKDGFDRQYPLFNCFVAVCDNKIVGYALYFYVYSTLDQTAIHLEDLYVTPDFRKKYVGSRLFDAVAKKTFSESCQYLDFSVLSWNPAQTFYKAKGSVNLTEMEGWHMYRLDNDILQNLVPSFKNNIYQIREARSDDLVSIKRLAQIASSHRNREPSNYHEIRVAIEENFDMKSPHFGYIVVILNNEVVGYALYCYAYSTWEGKSMYLQEFYVLPNQHDITMKRDLFLAVAKIAHSENCSRIDFWVLDPKNAGRFYVVNGATDLTENEEWHLYRLFELVKKPVM